jgi:transcriptional regulator with XRE-family HTH domain
MQAFLITLSRPAYDDLMPSPGRPSKKPRTPFGERLVVLRETAGLSQAQVAGQLGITQHAYAYWERNSVALRPEQLVQLASTLQTTVEELVHENTSKRRGGGPSGKARLLFEAVSKLPRRQQEKVLAILEPFVREHVNANS